LTEKTPREQAAWVGGEPARAQIIYALQVALEWIALVLTALIAIPVMLLACLLYPIIWFVQRLLEGS
jgi:hypothetical protein